jgi:hypothetical protein
MISGMVQDKWHYQTLAYDDPEPNEGVNDGDEDFSLDPFGRDDSL